MNKRKFENELKNPKVIKGKNKRFMIKKPLKEYLMSKAQNSTPGGLMSPSSTCAFLSIASDPNQAIVRSNKWSKKNCAQINPELSKFENNSRKHIQKQKVGNHIRRRNGPTSSLSRQPQPGSDAQDAP